jgi:hypothetical protein
MGLLVAIVGCLVVAFSGGTDADSEGAVKVSSEVCQPGGRACTRVPRRCTRVPRRPLVVTTRRLPRLVRDPLLPLAARIDVSCEAPR